MAQGMEKMKELVNLLNEAGKAYYQESREIVSNFEYDRLYDELVSLERETGIVLSDSPTIHVGYEILSELPKEKHETQMLSLDKTKEASVLLDWLNDQEGLLSWKLDGLTIVLTYENGVLAKAVTRGNGEIGEVITNNAKMFKNVPLNIAFQGKLVLRGEAVIRYSDFKNINDEIEDVDAKYKNPRNLCSGSVRQLNNEITARRNVHFFAFSLVSALLDGEETDFQNSRSTQMQWLAGQGFDMVEWERVSGQTIEGAIQNFAARIPENDFPSDGLVLILDNVSYGRSLGNTAKFPRDSIAYKWADEIMETCLLRIEWSASRTGLINPIAVFEPVELEGTTVSRASVHNISVMEGLALGIGDRIQVYKANMIIPQIADNLTRSGTADIPAYCPVCGGTAEIRQENDIKALYCTNSQCQAKKIKSFTHFAGRNAMNIDGLSEATIEKMVDRGFIRKFSDFYHIKQYRDEIIDMEGFGEKSYQNLAAAIEKSRVTSLERLIYSLGISNIGLSNAKLICREYHGDPELLKQADRETLTEIDGIGGVIAEAFTAYFEQQEKQEQFEELLKEVVLVKADASQEQQVFEGMIFVITGSLERFGNRNELKAWLEERGGKVTGSVTGKTSYLINNESTSASSKNKKARELSVPVITEEELLALLPL